MLVHLNELIRKKWQTRSIGNFVTVLESQCPDGFLSASILEKVLYKENKANIRLVGFQLLLSFLEALQVCCVLRNAVRHKCSKNAVLEP